MTENEWYIAHRYCPVCGKNVAQTLMATLVKDRNNFHDDINHADCFDFGGGCGWHGMLYQCISEKDVRKLKLEEIDKSNNK